MSVRSDSDAPGDPESVARAICLQLLASKARTRSELARTLRRRGVPDEVATRVLDRFTAVGLVDDGAYAEQWVRSRHEVRGLGRRALAVELRRKGIADQTVDEALSGIDRHTERRRARELVDRRLRSMTIGTPGSADADSAATGGKAGPSATGGRTGLGAAENDVNWGAAEGKANSGAAAGQANSGTPEAAARRLIGMLARKGYPGGLAYEVVRDALMARGAGLTGEEASVDLDAD